MNHSRRTLGSKILLFGILVLSMKSAWPISPGAFSLSSPPASGVAAPIPGNHKTRACNETIPLPGGEPASAVSASGFRDALKRYPALEEIFQTNREALVQGNANTRAMRIRLASGGDPMKEKYLMLRVDGVPPDAMAAFAETFLARDLLNHGEDAEVLALVKEIRARRPLQAIYSRLDEAEKVTYIKPQNLDNALLLFEAQARLNIANSPAQKLSAALDYLRVRNNIWSAMELFHRQDFDEEVTEVLAETLASVAWEKPAQWPKSAIASWRDGADRYILLASGALRVTVRLPGSDDDRLAEVLDGKSAAASFNVYVTAALTKAAADDVSAFNLHCDFGVCEMLVGGVRIALNAADLARLKSGQPLPDAHLASQALNAQGRKPLLSFGNAFTEKPTTQRDSMDAVLFHLQRAYPNALILRSRLTSVTMTKASALVHHPHPPASDVIAVVPEKESFKVDDRNIVANIRSSLTGKGMIVEDVPAGATWSWKHGTGKTVLVVTGHSTEALRDYVSYLGEKGVFRDNLVVLNSCGTVVTREIAEAINVEYGAVATMVFQGKIGASDVEDFLISLANGLATPDGQAAPQTGPAEFAIDVIRRAREARLPGLWTVARVSPYRVGDAHRNCKRTSTMQLFNAA